MEKLKDDIDAARAATSDDNGDDRPITERFQSVPMAARSAVVPVVDPRTIVSAPAAAAIVPPQVSTPPA